MQNYPYLYDTDFLEKMDKEIKKTQYVRIFVLDFNTEEILASIEGKATAGSCTVNGTSSARRAANCSFIVDPNGITQLGYTSPLLYNNITSVENLISINKKIKLETGFLNTTDQYQNFGIIWYPLGTYVIKTANISKNSSGLNISLTLNDKYSLLNGDMGGIFPAGILLSEKEDYIANSDGTIQKVSKKLLISDIIRYIVTEFGGEDAGNILITDIPNTIVKVMKWIGDSPLYYFQDVDGGKYFLLNENSNLDLKETYDYGQDVCYLNEPFVYPGKLEANAGETVASVLDKIKNMLGNYEWFYDINGKFVFQEIKNYINTSVTKTLLELQSDDYRVSSDVSTSIYTFEKDAQNLIMSISNNPQYQNIKNDFVVWGNTKTAAGVNKPIRYRLVLGDRPKVNSSELRLALTYIDLNQHVAIVPLKASINYEILTTLNESLMVDRKKYYLYYNKNFKKNIVYCWFEDIQKFAAEPKYEICYLRVPEGEWRTQLYFNGLWADKQVFAQYPYAAELNSEWPKIYNVRAIQEGSQDYMSLSNIPIYVGDYYYKKQDELVINTTNYEYWLDILEGSPFSVDSIGRRQKVVTESDVNCLFPVEVPNVILIEANGNTAEHVELANDKQQEIVQVSSKVYNNLTVGGGYHSAFDTIKDLLYQHTSYNENISLSVIPIYHLEPNRRITVNDPDIGICGDYLIKSISLPLSYNGTSNISATKIVEKTF